MLHRNCSAQAVQTSKQTLDEVTQTCFIAVRPCVCFNVRRFCRASLRLICISTAAQADSCQGFGRHGDEYNRVTGGPGATKKFQRGKNAVKRKERERDGKQETQTDRVLQYQYYKLLLNYLSNRILLYKVEETELQTDTVLQ